MFLFSHDWSSNGYPASEPPHADPRGADGDCDRAMLEQDTLSHLERRVIGLSLLDRPAETHAPSRLVRLKRWIFGSYPPNPLANERLEALRRYCIHVRLANGRVSAEDRSLALASGFSNVLLEQADELVATGRHGLPRGAAKLSSATAL